MQSKCSRPPLDRNQMKNIGKTVKSKIKALLRTSLTSSKWWPRSATLSKRRRKSRTNPKKQQRLQTRTKSTKQSQYHWGWRSHWKWSYADTCFAEWRKNKNNSTPTPPSPNSPRTTKLPTYAHYSIEPARKIPKAATKRKRRAWTYFAVLPVRGLIGRGWPTATGSWRTRC